MGETLTDGLDMFWDCEICKSSDWKAVFHGPVRDGAFGHLTEPTLIARCNSCGVDRLCETHCKDEAFYSGTNYRVSLEQGTDAETFQAAHDSFQSERLNILKPEAFRNKKVADIGCAGGSFLDHISGVASNIIAVEPGTAYHSSLEGRGYQTYSFAADAAAEHRRTIDWAVTFDVIEHTSDPRSFLTDVVELLAPNGHLFLSTPNRDDALIDLAGDCYREFFYRAHHRWYFDIASLQECARRCGLELENAYIIQRYGLSNAIIWIREGRPAGNEKLDVIDDPVLDAAWRRRLEAANRGDRLYAIFRRSES